MSEIDKPTSRTLVYILWKHGTSIIFGSSVEVPSKDCKAGCGLRDEFVHQLVNLGISEERVGVVVP